ncbi:MULTISPECIES: YibE/F family protein [Dethiosulfovibrio]|uniref:YibE/F family protein n=2 Tax=Dethiosulfovibrio TaxID=47054 RepID=A0ABS9EUB4_9BACT|nr:MULTISPECIES: YibE/F family protein [Dethiosulfovibrio]MCF4115194.1 YibE/F family protein [Dethiosulfovibrio russensis]MCF4143657.1 YibE/F family protein [Dethiosulfovibrio marinus]
MSRKKAFRMTLITVCIAIGSWFFGLAAGKIVVDSWDLEDCWIVEIETFRQVEEDPSEKMSEDDGWKSLRFEVLATFLTGDLEGRSGKVTVEQLEGSYLKMVPGKKYILMADRFPDGVVQYSVSDSFRLPWVVSFIVFSVSSVCFFAGWAGVRALIGLGISLAVLLKGFVPAVLSGFDPVFSAIVAVASVSVVTVFLVVRRPAYRPIAFLGAIGGACAAWALGASANWLWQITGLGGEGAALFASSFPGYDMRGIFLASVIIGAIGAVLDVAISVTSSMAELVDYDPAIPMPRLWLSGISVGREILGSMINTLILAYFGSSLIMTLLMVTSEIDLNFLLNDPMVAQELIQSLAGTMGLLLTVPLTATVAVWWLSLRRSVR